MSGGTASPQQATHHTLVSKEKNTAGAEAELLNRSFFAFYSSLAEPRTHARATQSSQTKEEIHETQH